MRLEPVESAPRWLPGEPCNRKGGGADFVPFVPIRGFGGGNSWNPCKYLGWDTCVEMDPFIRAERVSSFLPGFQRNRASVI